MSNLIATLSALSPRVKAAIVVVVLVVLYAFYTRGITQNPPAFYLDEAAVSYNAWHIYTQHTGDSGHYFPLYFPMFPLGPPFDYLGYVDGVQIYILAALDYVFAPSVAVSRGLSATMMFLAAILFGLLARRMSGRDSIGIVVALTALMTPWFFEIGRLAFGAPLYPFMLALLLLTVYRASEKVRWSFFDSVLIAVSLALSTYTYAIGRMFGPLLAVGLILFARDIKKLTSVLATWFLYALTLIPLLIFHLNNPGALAGRLNITVGYMSPEKSYGQIAYEFLWHYLANINIYQAIFSGDLNYRHHVPHVGSLLVVPLLLSLVGVIIVIVRHLGNSWWRYMLFGLVASPLPASMTRDDFHTLRLVPLPVFLLVFIIPTLMALLGKKRSAEGASRPLIPTKARAAFVGILFALTVAQAFMFYVEFRSIGNARDGYFDSNFEHVFAAAIEQPERPIYLPDQFYYHALWQAAVQGVDESNFVRLPPRGRPPADVIVLSGEEKCADCIMLVKDIPFVVYKTLSGPPPPHPDGPLGPNTSLVETLPLTAPRGIAADGAGNYLVADTGNSRIQKFDADGKFLAAFGTQGSGNGEFREPQGIAVDSKGDIWVTDAFLHKLMKFKPDGTFVKEWTGPDTGFYGPRDCEFGPTGELFIVDQGRNRISVFDPLTENYRTFGSTGTGEGQLNDPVGISIGGGLIYVADAGNRRIEVFDKDGGFMRQWEMPQWASEVQYVRDVLYDDVAKKVYVTSTKTDGIVAFDLQGNAAEGPRIDTENDISPPSALTIVTTRKRRELVILNTVGASVKRLELEPAKAEPKKK